MKKPLISRYLSQPSFDAAKKDFGFLIDKIKQSGFEYSLQIRDDYLNLYYKGNSLGKITYKKARKQYEVRVNYQFVEDLSFIVNRFCVLKFWYTVFLLVVQLICSLNSLSCGLKTESESLKYSSNISTLFLYSSVIHSLMLSFLNFLTILS